MTTPGRYAASDGSFAKSAGSAAARGGVLIALAVVIGFVLLWKGFDGGDVDADIAGAGASTEVDSTETGEDVPPSTETGEDVPPSTETGEDVPPATDPIDNGTDVVVDAPADVTVVVLNGTGEPGLAGSRGEALGAVGYTWTPGNASGVPVAESKVYFAPGFADEAKAVAEALSGDVGVLEKAPADIGALAADNNAEAAVAADVVVILGADEALS
jgi:LytR cell envelope-related transcriptional attenuator